jgi:dinuclear metal center YbgI/SA1388 family protein
MKAKDIYAAIEETAPLYLAEKWDNSGLQVGSRNQDVQKVLLALDVTESVVQEAVHKNVQLIVSHHPFIFNGIKSICVDSGKGKLVSQLIKHDISVYSAHTNLDSAKLGLNDFIAGQLRIKETQPLVPSPHDQLYKLVIFTPQNFSQKILEVLEKNGAGVLGKYSCSSFRTAGKSTFKPLEGANPYIGQLNKVETVIEDRIETIISQNLIKQILPIIKQVHPYEEMAYDLYPLDSSISKNENGLGKIGNLEKPLTSKEFISEIKEVLDLSFVRTAGPAPKKIKKVALCTGAGAEFISIAKIKGADAYITGDLKYHEAQNAKENDLWVVDAGHFGTEKNVVYLLEKIIHSAYPALEIFISNNVNDFFNIY